MPRLDCPHFRRHFWLPISAAALWLAPAASAVNIDWVTVGNPGTGNVHYTYRMSKYEVTNAQYVEFLNAKATSDPLGLYSSLMASGQGGITRSGSSGSFSYNVIPGRGEMPVNLVSFFDSLRFVNWLNNGQGGADTETGAYTLLGGTEFPSNWLTVTRNASANTVIPSNYEWFKAAFFSPSGPVYFDYPAGTSTQTVCAAPTATPNTANCDAPGNDASDPDVDGLTPVGAFTGSASPYGTYDQGGNVTEWTEDIHMLGSARVYRGGGWLYFADSLAASSRAFVDSRYADPIIGFRVASTIIPEPSTGLLLMTGLLGLAYRQTRKQRAANRTGA